MTEPITELKDKYTGYDIYVVAAGPSAGYINPHFFNNKVAIGVNQVWYNFWNLDYIVCKDGGAITKAIKGAESFGFELIVSKYQNGMRKWGKNEGGDYVFDHVKNEIEELDLSIVGTGKIVVSYSTITSAIHIAAYMGADNIILVGHDCGTIDGEVNMPGYTEPPHGSSFYRKFINDIEPQTLALREKLQEVYGVNIYSLNPFINLGMEGHEYWR